jgi:molybdate transport system permease protein
VSAPAEANEAVERSHKAQAPEPRKVGSDVPFYAALGLLGGFYVFLILGLIYANASFATPGAIVEALNTKEIRYSIMLSLVSCSITALVSVWIAVPIGYFMSRYRFPFQGVVDAVLDIPIVLPPLVIGLSLLILFQTPLFQLVDVTYEIPSVIVAQFMVACAFSVRTMRVTFDQISPRCEQVALTLGCSRSQAFWLVVLPEARRGVLAAGTIAWARSLGEFGPLLIFSGSTRMKTEVLPTTIFLEMSVGNLTGAVAVSLLMIMIAVVVLLLTRSLGVNLRG